MISAHTRAARALATGALALVLVVVAGCGGTGTSGTDGGGTSTGSTATTGGGPPVDGAVVVVADSIPDGRAITSGGGNPEYTFRSLWKLAVVEALKWKADAYLVSASGSFVNNDGVPSEWMMVFRTHEAGAKDLRLWIDPWGNVSRNEETAADDTLGTRAVMPNIIDSDEAVAKALPALEEKVAVAKTKDPRLGLGFREGEGPFWYFIVFDSSSADYVTVTMDANTGSVTGVK